MPERTCPVHGGNLGLEGQCTQCYVTTELLSGEDIPEPYRTLRDSLDSLDGRWYRVQAMGACAACGQGTRQRQMYCYECALALLYEDLKVRAFGTP